MEGRPPGNAFSSPAPFDAGCPMATLLEEEEEGEGEEEAEGARKKDAYQAGAADALNGAALPRLLTA